MAKWKCDICELGPCILKLEDYPGGIGFEYLCTWDVCCQIDHRQADWKIIEDKPGLKELAGGIEQLAKAGVGISKTEHIHNQLPNCGLCKWHYEEQNRESVNTTWTTEHLCSAIGYNLCKNVYDSELCRKFCQKKRTNEKT